MNALLVIDMQVGLFRGKTPRHDSQGVIQRINALIRAMGDAPVIFIQHDGVPGDTVEPHTPGWEILPELERRPSDPVIRKAACDSFYDGSLSSLLDSIGVKRLVMTGCCTEFCVDTTVRVAASKGYEVVVASDCHTTADRAHQEAESIIRHHNWVWSEIILPNRSIHVLPSEKIIAEMLG